MFKFSTELISIHSPLYIENNLNKINSNLIKKTLSDLDQEKPDVETIENFRSILIRHNSKLTEILKNLSMKQIAYLSKFLKKDLKYFSQLKNISFIFHNPDYNYDIISKKFKNIDKISQILDYFLNVLNSTKNLKKEEINKKCSEYIFINKKNVTNLDVFQGIKFVLTGKNYELLNLSEICEILGKEKIIERIENFNKICRNNKKSN